MQGRSRITRAFGAAAMTGLMAGAATSIMGCKKGPSSAQPGVQAQSGSASDAMQAKHDWKGMNSCKGQGGCKTNAPDGQ